MIIYVKKNFLRSDRQTDGQPKTTVRNLTQTKRLTKRLVQQIPILNVNSAGQLVREVQIGRRHSTLLQLIHSRPLPLPLVPRPLHLKLGQLPIQTYADPRHLAVGTQNHIPLLRATTVASLLYFRCPHRVRQVICQVGSGLLFPQLRQSVL